MEIFKLMEANKDGWTGAWRWVETLGVPMVDVPAALLEDLLKLRHVYPDIKQMVEHPVRIGRRGDTPDRDG